MMRRAALLVLCAFLLIWEPLRVAAEWQASIDSLSMRGAAAVIELLLHTGVAAFAVASAIALWNGSPAGATFASVALVASALVSVQSLYFSTLPQQTAPGQRFPLAAVAVAHGCAWLYFLRRINRA